MRRVAGSAVSNYLVIVCCADNKSYALSVRDFVEVTREVTIKHYRIHKLPDGSVYIARRCTFTDLLMLVEHYQRTYPPAYPLYVLEIKSF